MNKDFKNINVLKRLDPSILEIKDTYSHIVVYELVERKWRKKGIEGTGFLVLHPDSMSLFVMNRLGIENHQMKFSKIENLEILDEFLFYSNSFGIYGIWIYDVKDRSKFHNCFSQSQVAVLPQVSDLKEFKDLWDFIDPHKQNLDYVNFAHRIQVSFYIYNDRIMLP
jgi:hypothetical protein